MLVTTIVVQLSACTSLCAMDSSRTQQPENADRPGKVGGSERDQWLPCHTAIDPANALTTLHSSTLHTYVRGP